MRRLWTEHPNLLSWAALAAGMVVIVVLAARKVGFQPGQWLAIIVATVALAGLCVWIISWEDGSDEALMSGKEQDAAPASSEHPAGGDV